MRIRHLGDTKNVVISVDLSLQGAQDLALCLPENHGFTRDLWRTIADIEKEQEAARQEFPGIHIIVEMKR